MVQVDGVDAAMRRMGCEQVPVVASWRSQVRKSAQVMTTSSVDASGPGPEVIRGRRYPSWWSDAAPGQRSGPQGPGMAGRASRDGAGADETVGGVVAALVYVEVRPHPGIFGQGVSREALVQGEKVDVAGAACVVPDAVDV